MNLPKEVLDRINAAVVGLPVLTAKDIPDSEDSCPICLTSFSSIFQDQDSGAGVTKIEACNHIFCRKDLVQWMQTWHGNCPTCRHIFLDIRLPSESDDESSDGGEYVPDEDFDDEDDGFMDTDGFSEADAFSATFDEWGDVGSHIETDMEDVDDDIDDQAEWGFTDRGQPYTMAEDLEDEALEAGLDVGWCGEASIQTDHHSLDEPDEE